MISGWNPVFRRIAKADAFQKSRVMSRKRVAAVHGGTVVPHDHVTDRPVMLVDQVASCTATGRETGPGWRLRIYPPPRRCGWGCGRSRVCLAADACAPVDAVSRARVSVVPRSSRGPAVPRRRAGRGGRPLSELLAGFIRYTSGRMRTRPGSTTEKCPGQSSRAVMSMAIRDPTSFGRGIGTRNSTMPHPAARGALLASSPKSLSNVSKIRPSRAVHDRISVSRDPGASVLT